MTNIDEDLDSFMKSVWIKNMKNTKKREAEAEKWYFRSRRENLIFDLGISCIALGIFVFGVWVGLTAR